MREYTSKHRKQLRGLAHSLKPVVLIGKNGITDQLIQSVGEALLAHELIKVKFTDNKEAKKEMAEAIAERSDALLAGMVGNVAILYKPHPDKEKQHIEHLLREGDEQ